MRNNNQNFLYKNLNIIRTLKDYADKEKVTLLINEYNKKQETDYFLTQSNIKIGKIYTDTKNSNPFTYYLSPPRKNNFMNQRRQILLNDSSYNSTSNAYANFKRSVSLSSRKITRLNSNTETSNITKKNIIDNSDLKKHYNNISFKKIIREKTKNQINEENIKTRAKKINIKDLLIYKSSFYNLKSLEDSILYKNLNKESKYRSNLWNITLRNTSRNGKYEKLGYLNVGNKFEPKYTFFNMNKNLEYFSNPNKNSNECEKKGTYKRNLSLNIDDNLYNIKTRQNLIYLNNLKNLEINGKNLLDFEEARERKIKGNKILYKNEYLEYLFNKKINK